MAFETLLPFSRFSEITLTRALSRKDEIRPAPVVLEGRLGDAYDEQAFRHFLALERDRATLTDRRCLLTLVDIRRGAVHGRGEMPRVVASAVLAGLEECVREVDFVGWYRTNRVAGAVLTQGLEDLADHVPQVIAERVRRQLAKRLPGAFAGRLRVRVLALSPNHR
jgi:hypothetical protein